MLTVPQSIILDAILHGVDGVYIYDILYIYMEQDILFIVWDICERQFRFGGVWICVRTCNNSINCSEVNWQVSLVPDKALF